MPVEYGETWTYESIVSALPGIVLPSWAAVALQFLLFEAGVFVLAAVYDLWAVVPAGTAAVFVATAGSVEMLRISSLVRGESVPDSYRRLLFGSSIEVVLAVLAFVALVTHLFIFGPRYGTPLVERLLGREPPVVVVYFMLLLLWDVCYRIGTGWWASVVALWRSHTCQLDPETAATMGRADVETMGFGLLQLVLVPFLLPYPVLLTAVVGHVLAVTGVTGLSLLLLRRQAKTTGATPI